MNNIVENLYSIRDNSKNLNQKDLGFMGFCLTNLHRTKSQCFQDLWVLYHYQNNFPDNFPGFYIEFGATDGITGSNSYALENLGWHGILLEPNPIWHNVLYTNRGNINTNILPLAVYSKSNEIVSFITPDAADLATIEKYVNDDYHAETRKINPKKYDVVTISLDDLIGRYVPHGKNLTYISIDTEGSELDILENFSFKRKPRMFSIEHNYDEKRKKSIDEIMEKNGYKQEFANFSKWDAWYYLNEKSLY